MPLKEISTIDSTEQFARMPEIFCYFHSTHKCTIWLRHKIFTPIDIYILILIFICSSSGNDLILYPNHYSANMTINRRSKTVRHGSTMTIALVIAFGTAFLTPAASFAAEPQDSVVTDVLVMPCSATDRYTAVIEGIFLSPITSVLVDGFVVDSSLWVQSKFDLTINMPPSRWSSHTLEIVNGLTPALVQEVLYCAGAEVLPTETGGSIPNTGTNNYNNLLVGFALLMAGSIGLLFRKRIITN